MVNRLTGYLPNRFTTLLATRKRCCSNQINSCSLLYRTLRWERCWASVSGVCYAFRFCAPTPAVGDGGVDARVSAYSTSIGPEMTNVQESRQRPRDEDTNGTPMGRHRHFFCVTICIWWRCSSGTPEYPRLYSVTVVLHLSTAIMYLNLGRALSHFYFIGPFCMPCIIIIMVPIEIDIEYAYSILINFIDYSLLCALLSIILYNYI